MDLLSTSVINARNSWRLRLPEDGSLARLRRQRDGAQGAGAAQRGAGGGGRRLSGTQECGRCSLYPLVKLEEGERDITLFCVEARGKKDGAPRQYKTEMVNRYDETQGFTSMARSTAFRGPSLPG